MLSQPRHIDRQRLDEPDLAGAEARAGNARLLVEVDVVEVAQVLMRLLAVQRAAQHGHDRLAAFDRALDLAGTHVGNRRVRGQHEHDDVAFEDELAEALLPFLGTVNALAVDDRLEALPFKDRDELVSKREIATGVGDTLSFWSTSPSLSRIYAPLN